MRLLNLKFLENFKCNSCEKLMIKNKEITFTCSKCEIFFCLNCINTYKDKPHKTASIHQDHNLFAFKNIRTENLIKINESGLFHSLIDCKNFANFYLSRNFLCAECRKLSHANERFICLLCSTGSVSITGYKHFCYHCFFDINKDEDKYNCLEQNESKVNDGYIEKIHPSDHIYLYLQNYEDYWSL